MTDYTINDFPFAVGDRVRAFHPQTLGVVYHGDIVTIGRKYITIDFGELLGGQFKVAPEHVVGGAS